uniref:BZIP domain-containing protein n=1 Tax=Echinostoma caproni TaxID=27848 RepID=A0A183AVH9_9TREM
LSLGPLSVTCSIFIIFSFNIAYCLARMLLDLITLFCATHSILEHRVLSDPQERAWYDSHRAQILQTDYEEERVDVFPFFARSCFDRFDDGKKGFYTVYRKVFNNEKSNQNGRSSREYPSFGQSDSLYTDVVASFYQFWEAFRTHKNYTWVEKYDIRFSFNTNKLHPNLIFISTPIKERRAMEQENKRLRNAARRKRNEEVRQLVAFVKKRDKRVAAERERIQQVAQEAQARTQKLAREARQRCTRINQQLSAGYCIKCLPISHIVYSVLYNRVVSLLA